MEKPFTWLSMTLADMYKPAKRGEERIPTRANEKFSLMMKGSLSGKTDAGLSTLVNFVWAKRIGSARGSLNRHGL